MALLSTFVFVNAQTVTTYNDCLYTVKFGDWISTNKENGSVSSQKYTFQGEEGDFLYFDWKTSTEEYCDKLVVSIDGEYVLTKSGEDSGTYKYPILSAGNHIVEFVYAKDYFSSAGDDEVKISNVRVECFGDAYIRTDYSISNSSTDYPRKVKYNIEACEGDIFSFRYRHFHDQFVTTSLSLLLDGNEVLKSSVTGYIDIRDEDGHALYESYNLLLPTGIHSIEMSRTGSFYHSSMGGGFFDNYVGIKDLCFVHYVKDSKHKSQSIVDGVPVTVNYNSTIHDFEFTRTYNNTKWQSFYVPFSMSYDDWKDDFDVAKINDINMYDTDGDGEVDETELEIIMVKKGSLKPNHPYLIKAKTPGEKTIKLTDAILYAKKDTVGVSSAEMKFTFVGTLEGVSGEEMVNNKYYAMSGGALAYTEDTNASLKPFRWYMKAERRDGQIIMPTVNNSRIRVKVFGEDGESTGVDEFAAEENVVESNVVYSLDGRVASGNGAEGLRPGIYISNGKKVFVK